MKIRSAIAVALATFGAITLTAIPAAASVEAYCGMVVTDPGAHVTLSADLDCSTDPYTLVGLLPFGTPAITIAAPSVTLDLQGHTLTGDSYLDYDGIRVQGSKGSTISHGKIRGFGLSLEVRNSGELTVSDLDIEDSGYIGIEVKGSASVAVSNARIQGLNIWDVEEIFSGIDVRNSHHVTLTNITQSLSGQNGIVFEDSDYFSLSHSTLESNEVAGVLVMGQTKDGSISDVSVVGSGSGVNAWNIPDPGAGETALTLDRITVDGTHGRLPVGLLNRNGIYIADAHGISVNEVHVSDASNGVTVLDSSQNITVTNSSAIRSFAYGFGVSTITDSVTANIVFRDNAARENGFSGFVFENSWVRSARNVSTGNTGFGFWWKGGPGGTSSADVAKMNTASGFLVAIDAAGSVRVTGATAMDNGESGLTLESGAALVAGGRFLHNAQQGVFARAGTLYVTRVTANQNLHSGVYFGAASSGSAANVSAAKNRIYGLAIVRGAGVTDRGGHALVDNGVANLCRGVCRI